MAVGVQAKRPIESAAERKGASVGPEGRTERHKLSGCAAYQKDRYAVTQTALALERLGAGEPPEGSKGGTWIWLRIWLLRWLGKA